MYNVTEYSSILDDLNKKRHYKTPHIHNAYSKTLQVTKNHDKTKQALTVGGLCTAGIAGSELLSNKLNHFSGHDIRNLIISLAVLGFGGYGVAKAVPPMWKEVTEFQPDSPPFITANMSL